MHAHAAIASRSVPVGVLAFSRQTRAAPRVAHRTPCRVMLTDAETGSKLVLDGETLNLSRTGLSVQIGRQIPRGTTVEVLLEAPEGGPSCLAGAVVHSRRVLTGTYEVGIQVAGVMRPLHA